jgi:DNA-binding response OmpR family regulator
MEANTPGIRKSVLIIDDEVDILNSLSVFLRRQGYATLVADTGKEGIRLAQKEVPSLIILDLILPDIDGSDVAVRLLENSLTKDIPIVFLTSVVRKTEQQEPGEMVGNRCIVAKPCPPDEILTLIKAKIGSAV